MSSSSGGEVGCYIPTRRGTRPSASRCGAGCGRALVLGERRGRGCSGRVEVYNQVVALEVVDLLIGEEGGGGSQIATWLSG